MIVVHIMGGLGNQIAQYLFARTCADHLGVELKLDIRSYRTYRLHAYGLDKFQIRAEVATDAEADAALVVGSVRETTIHYDPSILSQVRDGCYLYGYWGDYRYSLPRIAELRGEFRPRQALRDDSHLMMEQIRACASVSVYIRRGDYVTTPNCVVLPLQYYQDAMVELVEKVPRAHFFIFSDDIRWAQTHLRPPGPHTFVYGNDASRNLDDFELMRACKHHIIANSSFSFWAALLDNKMGHVIAPQQYFTPTDPGLKQLFGRVDQPMWPLQWLSMPVRQTLIDPVYTGIAGGFSARRPLNICVWNYYEELTTDGFLFKNLGGILGHNLLKPWVDIYAYGQANGLHFVTFDQVGRLDGLDAVVFLDRPREDSLAAAALLELDVPKYLLIFETEVIKPDNWGLDFHRRMRRVFTWSDTHVDHKKYIKMNFASDSESPFDFEVLKTAFHQRKLCTLIASAKGSGHPSELYSARVRTIEWLQAQAPQDFDLYGVGWDVSAFNAYRGPIRDKLSVLARYRFAICYENATHYDGYITEKIIDCFRAGVVPVYWGAPNIDRWIPRNCFIDRTAFATEEALYQHLRDMPEAEYSSYLDAISGFLESADFYPFSTEYFITNLTAYIASDIKEWSNERPTVSVCIPTYNYGHYIAQCMDSVLSQEDIDLEILVFDNASTDKTIEILAPYRAYPNVRIMRNSINYGSRVNWTNCFHCAAGQYMVILSADDYFLPGHLARGLAILDQNTAVALVYTSCLKVDENSQSLGFSRGYGHRKADYLGGRNELADLLTYDCYITPSAAILRKDCYDALGHIDIGLHAAGDWYLWIIMALQFPDFAYIKDPGVAYRIHAAQHTQAIKTKTHFLEDHVCILEHLLGQGHLSLLTDKASEIASLLWARYLSAPQDQASPWQSRVRNLEVQLLNSLLARDLPAVQELGLRESVVSWFTDALQNKLEVIAVVDSATQLLAAGHPSLATALYRVWVSHSSSPLRYVVAFNLGVALCDLGNISQAHMYLDHACRWNPDFLPSRLALAQLPSH